MPSRSATERRHAGSHGAGRAALGGLALAIVVGACAATPTNGAATPAVVAAATSPPPHACGHLQVEARRSDARGEFEGTYRVGRTRCSVVPGRMVYALQWARGHRPMDFFYEGESAEGEPVFVSEPRDEGVDRFYFADRGHDRGVFVRADGLCLPVRRVEEPSRR